MSQIHPIVEDICGRVVRLLHDQPIQDDNPDLYYLCVQLEELLRIDRKDKSSFFGAPKTFFDYFCQALASKRTTHEGIHFAKGIQEVKTSEGRGRVFIRFCLMSGCLADTLQQCLLNEQVTNDWFGQESPLQHPQLSDQLLHSLYDLSDVHFVLDPPTDQLDTQWPQHAILPTSSATGILVSKSDPTSCSQEATTSHNHDPLDVAGWPPPQDFVQITAVSPNNQCTSPININTKMSHSNAELLSGDSKFAEFLKFTLGKIVGLKMKLHNFAASMEGISNCPLDLNLITEDFRNDLEIIHTATFATLSDLDQPIPRLSLYSTENVPDVAVSATEKPLSNVAVSLTEKPVPDVAIGSTTETADPQYCPPNVTKVENAGDLEQKLLRCENKCKNLEERNKWMKEAVGAANMVVAQEVQKMNALRSQLGQLKCGEEESRANDSKIMETNEVQLELLNDKLRKMLTLVTMQQEQIGTLKHHLETSRQENRTIKIQMDKLQKALQTLETSSGQRNRSHEESGACQAEGGQLVKCQEPQLPTEPVSIPAQSAAVSDSATHTPTISSVSKTLTRLHSFIQEKLELEQELESAKEMTSSLMNKVAEQEQKLSNVTLELSDTRSFVSRLQAAFAKLQTNDSILRYELREKRRIFNALKQQLEGSRAEWKQIQQKNTVSLLEWQSLRDEFASRHKQSSEESGYGEEGSQQMEDGKDEAGHSSERGVEGATAAHHPDILVDINRSADESAEKKEYDVDKLDARGRRLKLLEEQCKLLCKKLVKSAVHCAKLDSKLTSLHDQYGSPDTERPTRDASPPENISEDAVPVFASSPVEESSLVVEDMLEDLLTNITEVRNPSLCLDPGSETGSREDTLSTSMDRLTGSEHEDPDTPLQPPKSLYCKPSAFTLAHALPKRVEKLKQEKEEMQQVLETLRKERDVQEKRETILLAQINELQNTQAAKHDESIAVIENLQAELQQMTSQWHDECLAKQQLQEELKQVIFGREEKIQQMTAQIHQLQMENQKLQT